MVKNMTANAVDMGSIPGPGRSPGGGNGDPLQCSCLRDSRDRGTTWTIPQSMVHGVSKSCSQLNTLECTLF